MLFIKIYNIFKSLKTPIGNEKDLYKAEVIEDSSHRIAINQENQLTLLLKTIDTLSIEPRSFTNLEIRHSVECSIEKETNSKEKETFTIIVFKNKDDDLIKRFLELITLMLDNFKNEISTDDIEKFVEELIEIFKPEEKISKTTLIGLIGELIIIYISDNKDELINAWHTRNSENFDFYKENVALEIKSTLKNTRIHTFKINQLYNPKITIFIGSILIKEKINGINIDEICSYIKSSIKDKDIEKKFITKLYKVIKTSSVNDFEIDLNYSKNNFLIYDAEYIPKITDAPLGVTEVKFNSDLTFINPSKESLNNLFV